MRDLALQCHIWTHNYKDQEFRPLLYSTKYSFNDFLFNSFAFCQMETMNVICILQATHHSASRLAIFESMWHRNQMF
jgi:hypothetical protein